MRVPSLLCGGERDGALLAPAVLDHVSPTLELVALETFGPVAPIIRVRDLDEAIATANATRYTLSSSVCTLTGARSRAALRAARGNRERKRGSGLANELTPFGGSEPAGSASRRASARRSAR